MPVRARATRSLVTVCAPSAQIVQPPPVPVHRATPGPPSDRAAATGVAPAQQR